MNLNEEYNDESCLFCMKTADEVKLIEMNNNLLQIGSENIEFSTIIFDVVQRMIISDRVNHICDDCNNLLIDFYLFRSNAQKNVNLIDEKYNTVAVEHVPQFLEEIETENVSILKSEMKIETQETSFDDDLDNDTFEHEQDELEEYSTLKQGFKPRKKISDLSSQELALRTWCLRQAKTQKTTIQTPQGTTTQWSCSKCRHTSNNRKYFMQHLKRKHAAVADDTYVHLDKENVTKWHKNTYTPQQLEMKNWYAEQMKSQVSITKTVDGEIMLWSCSQCSYKTTTCAKTFAKHLKTKHFNEKDSSFNKFSCRSCCINYQTISQSNAHLKFHEFINVIASHMNYPECEQCRIMFCNINDLSSHLIIHKSPRFSHKPVPSIGFMVRKVQHVETGSIKLLETNNESLWKCGHCIKIFDDKLECLKHQMLFHVKIFVCPFDNQEFKDGNIISNFRVHARRFHKQIFQDIIIMCSYCRLKFEDQFEKLSHMKVCAEKKLECAYCSRRFFKKYSLIKHVHSHVGINILTCDICGKTAPNTMHLKIHMRSHSTERPYKCGLCDRKYTTNSGRASHMQNHADTNIVCPVCSLVFKRRSLFQRHYNMQHNDAFREAKFKKFTCNLCSKSFLEHYRFVHHMKYMHQISKE